MFWPDECGALVRHADTSKRRTAVWRWAAEVELEHHPTCGISPPGYEPDVQLHAASVLVIIHGHG